MRPPLVALDFRARTARRYYPKPNGGLMVDEVGLCAPQDQDASMPAAIEEFRVNGTRTGRRHVNVPQGQR